MRKLLDRTYAAALGLAAVCMVGVLLCIVGSVITRQVNFHIDGLDSYAGYLMASAGFLALAGTLRHGEHIRVTLVLNALNPQNQNRLYVFAGLVGVVLSAALAFYSIKLSFDSYTYNDMSTGSDATPLWIPQLSMALGTSLFFIAMVDATVSRLKGHPLKDLKAPEALHE